MIGERGYIAEILSLILHSWLQSCAYTFRICSFSDTARSSKSPYVFLATTRRFHIISICSLYKDHTHVPYNSHTLAYLPRRNANIIEKDLFLREE